MLIWGFCFCCLGAGTGGGDGGSSEGGRFAHFCLCYEAQYRLFVKPLIAMKTACHVVGDYNLLSPVL